MGDLGIRRIPLGIKTDHWTDKDPFPTFGTVWNVKLNLIGSLRASLNAQFKKLVVPSPDKLAKALRIDAKFLQK